MEALLLLIIDFVKWIIENKELAFVICMSILVPGYFHHRKKKRRGRTHPGPSRPPQPTPTSGGSSPVSTKTNCVQLRKIQLYSTGKKGKVFTTEFHKMMNHNFGIELTLENTSSSVQNVKVGWCICKGDDKVINGTFNKRIHARQTLTCDFFVKQDAFARLQPGEYKSLFWVNDVRVQRKYFKILSV